MFNVERHASTQPTLNTIFYGYITLPLFYLCYNNMTIQSSKSGKTPSSGIFLPMHNKGYDKLSAHELLLADELRNSSFRQAIHNTVAKGDIVIDIGTGTGILAFYALEAGAHQVYAIEQNKNILEVARKEAEKRSMADKIRFINANFNNLPQDAIPRKVDVVVSEMIAVFGIEEAILPLMSKAKEFLKPDGKIIPCGLSLFISPIQMDQQLQRQIGLNDLPIIQMKMDDFPPAARAMIKYLAQPKKLADIDFYAENTSHIKAQVQFRSVADADLYGICGWFEARLDGETSLSNSPFGPAVHWAQLVFKTPIQLSLQAGEELTVNFKAISSVDYTLFIFDLESDAGKMARITSLFKH
jgi:ubiquinone/menaquinone biosynthesis C-methylase UbiE